MNKQPVTAIEMNQHIAKQTPHSHLGQLLATERANAIKHPIRLSKHAVPFMVMGLTFIHIIAFLMALSIVQQEFTNVDVASQLQDVPTEFYNTSSSPVQPDIEERLLEPLLPNQLGDSLTINNHLGQVRLRGLEITQGIQVFNELENPQCNPNPNHENYIFCNNSVPLVAGRHTLLRVYLACNGNCPTTDMLIRLQVIKDGLVRDTLSHHLAAGMLAQLNTVSSAELRLSLQNSVNFEFLPPPDWMKGEIRFELDMIPVTLQISHQTDIVPLTYLSATFIERKPLRVAYLPIQYQGQTPQAIDEPDYWLKRMYPVSEVEYYRLPMPDLVWDKALNKNDLLQKLLYTYWLYAIYHPPQEWPDQLFGWLPPASYNGGASDPFWCPHCAGPHSSRVGFGGLRPELDIGGPRILVHEIAHNLGAQHAWSPTQAEDSACFRGEGVDIQVDPAWPYAETPFIQEVGIDLYSEPPIIYPAQQYDMMAYCTQPWISPHTYRTLFNSPFLDPEAKMTLSLADYQPEAHQTDTGALLISGIVYPDGTVSQPEVIQLEGQTASSLADSFSPSTSGDYCITVHNDQHNLLGEQCFDVGFINVETGLPSEEASSFFVSIPNISADSATEVTLTKFGKPLATLQASQSAPQVTITYPNKGELLDGQQTIMWNSFDADGDKLFYDVLYSPDAGQSWLPIAVRLTQNRYTFHTRQLAPTQQGLIRVIASDGFHTQVDETDSTFGLNVLSNNSISIAGPVSIPVGQTFQVEVMANEITEPKLTDITFTLNFDPAILQIDTISFHPMINSSQATIDQDSQGQVEITIYDQTLDLTGKTPLVTLGATAHSKGATSQLYLTNFEAHLPNGAILPISEIWELSFTVK